MLKDTNSKSAPPPYFVLTDSRCLDLKTSLAELVDVLSKGQSQFIIDIHIVMQTDR